MKVVPIRFVTDVQAARRFYGALGLEVGSGSRSGAWLELTATGGMLALHHADRTDQPRRPGEVTLTFEADEPLEQVAERLTSAGFPVEGIVDEAFGRSLLVRDPDGALVQVNEHDRELYA